MQAAATTRTAGEQSVGARSVPDGAPDAGVAGGGREDPAAPQHAIWLAATARGDQRAFEAFYEATLPRVYALARRICVDPGLTEEVAEDAYVQVWRDAGRYDAARGVPLAWLLTITRSRALDALRRRDEAQSVSDPDDLVDQPDADADPLDLLALFERTSATRRALAALPARERQLVALAFLRGLTHAEIAAETGWPLGTIKTTIRRALATLRQMLLPHAPHGAGLGEGDARELAS
jgi:RNA polymerase sigma-70 factor (ECF subfamily)